MYADCEAQDKRTLNPNCRNRSYNHSDDFAIECLHGLFSYCKHVTLFQTFPLDCHKSKRVFSKFVFL